LAKRQQGNVIIADQKADAFVLSPQMVRDLDLIRFARGVLAFSASLRPSLPSGAGGRPVSRAFAKS
jgi:hypothetical protein